MPSPDLPSSAVSRAIARATHDPFTVEEVVTALGAMHPNKSAGLALYGVDIFRGASDAQLYSIVGRLFDSFAMW